MALCVSWFQGIGLCTYKNCIISKIHGDEDVSHVFCIVMLCGLVAGYHCYGGMYHLHLQDEAKKETIC
jgi:hypothetical protein